MRCECYGATGRRGFSGCALSKALSLPSFLPICSRLACMRRWPSYDFVYDFTAMWFSYCRRRWCAGQQALAQGHVILFRPGWKTFVGRLRILRHTFGSTTLLDDPFWSARSIVMVLSSCACVPYHDRIGFFLGGALCGPRLFPLVVGSTLRVELECPLCQFNGPKNLSAYRREYKRAVRRRCGGESSGGARCLVGTIPEGQTRDRLFGS